MTLPGNKNHVGILDKYILFSDNVMIRIMKCFYLKPIMSRSITQPTNHPSSQSLTHSITHFPLPPTMLLHSSPNQSPTPLKK